LRGLALIAEHMAQRNPRKLGWRVVAPKGVKGLLLAVMN
jgi:hypothetical protein